MAAAPQPRQQLLLRGAAHGFGRECASVVIGGGRSAAATSAGGEYVQRWKGHLPAPN